MDGEDDCRRRQTTSKGLRFNLARRLTGYMLNGRAMTELTPATLATRGGAPAMIDTLKLKNTLGATLRAEFEGTYGASRSNDNGHAS
jgi:hypothetical protein